MRDRNWWEKWWYRRRFQFKVWPRGDCWEWRGAIKKKTGYGSFAVDGTKRIEAHRASYLIAKGPIPQGLEIDHICRHRWCVRPSHLEAVSHKENLRRGDTNAEKPTCKRGHPFNDANTYHVHGRRWCRVCDRERKRRERAA